MRDDEARYRCKDSLIAFEGIGYNIVKEFGFICLTAARGRRR